MADESFSLQPDYISSDRTVAEIPLDERFTSESTLNNESLVAVWPPPRQMYRRRETLSPLMLTLIIALVTLLIVGSLGLVAYLATVQYHTTLTTQAKLDTQATAHIYATASAQTQATAQALATTQANIDTTATAQANQTAVATAQANQATATATAFQGMLTTATSGTAALHDPLSDNSLNNAWDEGATKTGGCRFTNGSYQANEALQGYFQPCIAEAARFSNFAYQVQMTITQGTQGGILFRADGTLKTFYLFRIGTDGSYALDLYRGSKQATTLVSGFSPAITTGVNQANQLTVLAQSNTLDLFANGQFITSTSDTDLSSGQIGVVALDYSIPSEASFSDAQVWKL